MSEAATLRPGLFLDRDGVINEDINFLYRPEDCRLIDGAASLIRTSNRLGYVVCVVTNQSGIGRGLYSEEEFHQLMEHMSSALLREGARLDAIYFSPDHPVHGVGRYKRESDRRKPAPGMLMQAAAEHGIDLGRSVLVGDRCSDLRAGHAAGLSQLFLFGTTEADCSSYDIPYNHINTLSLVETYLVATRGQ